MVIILFFIFPTDQSAEKFSRGPEGYRGMDTILTCIPVMPDVIIEQNNEEL